MRISPLPRDIAGSMSVALVSASIGSGHMRAAAAVGDALTEWGAKASPVIDALETSPAWFRRVYRDGYLRAIRLAPRLVGALYDLSDRKRPLSKPGKGPMARTEDLVLRALGRHATVQFADAIVSTHFLTSSALGRLRLRGRLRARLITVVTDEHPHAIWLSAGSDLICVASEAARTAAIANGIPAHRLAVTGIPVDLRVAQLIAQTRESGERTTRQPQILICGGGHGLGPMEAVVRSLVDAEVDATLAIVCGHNTALQQRLNQVPMMPGSRTTLRVIGFTDQMPALMASSDLMIGKPGGLTAAEARAAGLPLLVLDPIPGQEERNARILIAAGAARSLTNPRGAGEAVQSLLSDQQALAAMRMAAASAARPHAAHEIARAVLAQAARLPVKSPDRAMEDCARAPC